MELWRRAQLLCREFDESQLARLHCRDLFLLWRRLEEYVKNMPATWFNPVRVFRGAGALLDRKEKDREANSLVTCSWVSLLYPISASLYSCRKVPNRSSYVSSSIKKLQSRQPCKRRGTGWFTPH